MYFTSSSDDNDSRCSLNLFLSLLDLVDFIDGFLATLFDLKFANFIINYKGRAKSKQIKELADLLKAKVNEKFGIRLEEEIEYKGNWK